MMYNRLNYLRFFLALTVLVYHTNYIAVPLAGLLAVWCFFLISGYLVSDILYGKYRNRPADFLLNRFLRIYPIYWVSLTIGVMFWVLFPESAGNDRLSIFQPQGFGQWQWNITLFGAEGVFAWTVKTAWSLAVEMNWYVILFIGSFFPKRFLMMFLVAMLALPFLICFGFGDVVNPYGAGFAFALGAIFYHLKPRIPVFVQGIALLLIPVLLFVVPIYFKLSPFDLDKHASLLVFLSAPLLIALAMPWLTRETSAGKFSSLLGDLSYPIFLTHFYAACLAREFTGLEIDTWPFVLAVFLICLMISLCLLYLVDRPIAGIRAAIRNKA